MLVFDELVLHLLLQVCALGAQIRHAVDHVLHEMKPVEVVLNPHVEGCCDGALLLVAAHVEFAVGPSVGQAMDQPWVSMETKDDVLIDSEE